MLRILKIIATSIVIVVCIVVAYFSVGRTLDGFEGFQIQSVGLYEEHKHLKPDETLKSELSDIQENFRQWWEKNNHSWKPTPATYIPGFTIRTDKGSLNFLGDGVIVNCCGGQYTKSLSKEEQDLVQGIKESISWSN